MKRVILPAAVVCMVCASYIAGYETSDTYTEHQATVLNGVYMQAQQYTHDDECAYGAALTVRGRYEDALTLYPHKMDCVRSTVHALTTK